MEGNRLSDLAVRRHTSHERPGRQASLAVSVETRVRWRRGFGQLARLVVASMVSAAAVGCTPHPVGPARTFDDYEGKARTTAESALSVVETARLGAAAAAAGNTFGPYVGVLFSDQEEALSGVAGTLASIQPPDERADRLRDELGALLDRAIDHVADVRIAARRGDLDALDTVAAPLAGDSRDLRAFLEEHAG
jgi:hypothetical protein